MMKIVQHLVCCILFLLISCKEEPVDPCQSLRKDLLAYNVTGVKSELDTWLSDLPSVPVVDDPLGHFLNLQSFIDRLENDCNLEGSMVCYACIETYPVLSEVRIVLDSAGHTAHRILDIVTPLDSVMTIRDIHQ